MIFNTPRRLAVAALVFIGGMLVTFFFASAHKRLEYEGKLADFRHQLTMEYEERADKSRSYYRGEISKHQKKMTELEIAVERLRGELNLCAKGGDKNAVVNQY